MASGRIAVHGGGVAPVQCACSGGTVDCSGKLTLATKETTKTKGGKRRSRTVTIGSADFTIAPLRTTATKIDLNSTGRALLGSGHGRLSAALTILELAPEATQPATKGVHLMLQSNSRKARRRKR